MFVDGIAAMGAESTSMVLAQAKLWIVYPLLAALSAVALGSGTASFFVWIVESLIVETALGAVNQPWANAIHNILPGGAANNTAGTITLVIWVAALAAVAYATANRRAVK
mgnify:FL=1